SHSDRASVQAHFCMGLCSGELASLIESYRRGGVPLSEPMSLLRRHLLKSGATYALNQAYLRSDLWSVISRAYNSVLGVGPHLRP
ncbi:MAG: DUF1722 domain-containing protein, partial [Gammaproteobacteria bacterium]|nr:DUF1722 domain-containing protein [Gammaproteobacteria bacterium]